MKSCLRKDSAMQPDALFYAVATVAVVILGLSKGGFAGVGMISTPLLALVIGPIAAAGVIFPILIVQDLIAVAMYRRTFSWQILATMIPGAALGVCLAYSLASSVPGWAVEIVLGVVSLAFSLHQIRRQLKNLSLQQPAHDHARMARRAQRNGIGFHEHDRACWNAAVSVLCHAERDLIATCMSARACSSLRQRTS